MIHDIRIKTESWDDFLKLKEMINVFMERGTSASGEPYFFNGRNVNTHRELKYTATPPNRNITDEQLLEYWPRK